MNRKGLIQTVVAIACLVGAFMVLYNNGVFSGQPLSQVSFKRTGGSASKTAAGVFGKDAILPYGKLSDSDFDRAFGTRKSGTYKYQYPKLNLNSDVKVDVKDLFLTATSGEVVLPQQ